MVEAADHEPEELVASVEAGPALGAERDLELLAEQQVLEDEALTAAEGTSKRGQEEADEFDHPRQDPIVTAPARASEAFAPYTISRTPALERSCRTGASAPAADASGGGIAALGSSARSMHRTSADRRMRGRMSGGVGGAGRPRPLPDRLRDGGFG